MKSKTRVVIKQYIDCYASESYLRRLEKIYAQIHKLRRSNVMKFEKLWELQRERRNIIAILDTHFRRDNVIQKTAS